MNNTHLTINITLRFRFSKAIFSIKEDNSSIIFVTSIANNPPPMLNYNDVGTAMLEPSFELTTYHPLLISGKHKQIHIPYKND